MKQRSFLSAAFIVLSFNAIYAQDTLAIKQTLLNWNKAVTTKNVEMAASVFDNEAKVIFAGSEENEIFKGVSAIRHSIEEFFSKPVTLSWNFTHLAIDQNKETAWVFVDGTITLKRNNGSTVTTPYRITVVMVKKGKAWKWRLFNGSAPEKKNE